MSYKDNFNERDYAVILEYEQHGKTFAEIARTYDISSARIKGVYNRAKRKQVMLYLQAVSAAEGNAGNDLKEPYTQLFVQFGSPKYAAAYMEKEHEDILTSFRDGEPPSPYEIPEISENNRIFCSQLIIQVLNKGSVSNAGRLTHIPVNNPLFVSQSFYRIELNGLESAVLREKGENKNFKEIGKQLSITADMARNVYMKARRVELQNYIIKYPLSVKRQAEIFLRYTMK